MSAIAGIVCLNPSELLKEQNLHLMLEAMRPSIPSRTETCAMTGNTAIIGKVVYGPNNNSKQKHGNVIEKPHVFCIGEIYNDDVSQAGSAGQFLLERYLQRGVEDFATGLNGTFAAVITDPRDGSVTLVTDHTDSWPFYTIIHSNKLYFASEVKALARVAELPCEPDLSSVLSLATRGFFVRRRTLLKDVQQMDYATICHIQDGKIRSWPYWRYIVEPSPDRGYQKYLEEFACLLRQAVKRRVSKGRIAIMLSGGIDSRGILCCLDKPSEISAVTYTDRTLETRHKFGDWALAEAIAERLGINLSIIHCDEREFARAMQESVYASDAAAGFVCENIWEDIKQASEAEYLLMGDECLGWATGPMSSAQALTSIGIHSLRSLNELQSCMPQNQLDSFIELSERDIESINTSCKAKEAYDCVDQLYFEQRLIHFLLSKRRVIARHGLFVRNPWLDLDILNFVRQLPTHHRVSKSLFRSTINYINPSLASLPRARVAETINYESYLSKIEQEQGAISRMVIEDNPLLEEFFDICNIQKLIKKVCSGDAAIKPSPRFELLALFPMEIRLKLRSYFMRLTKPEPKLSGVELVLRITMVATALRYLKNRFKSKL